ncbi:hypothetical protein CGRA01v4_01083 [Colletotrichum graminicola]|nr:hypothetical protein CGRA01v4_01083 [Colletotrichum graminicola]
MPLYLHIHTTRPCLSILGTRSLLIGRLGPFQLRGRYGLDLDLDATRLHPSLSSLPAWVWSHISLAGTQAATIHHRSPLLLEARNSVFPLLCVHIDVAAQKPGNVQWLLPQTVRIRICSPRTSGPAKQKASKD